MYDKYVCNNCKKTFYEHQADFDEKDLAFICPECESRDTEEVNMVGDIIGKRDAFFEDEEKEEDEFVEALTQMLFFSDERRSSLISEDEISGIDCAFDDLDEDCSGGELSSEWEEAFGMFFDDDF